MLHQIILFGQKMATNGHIAKKSVKYPALIITAGYLIIIASQLKKTDLLASEFHTVC